MVVTPGHLSRERAEMSVLEIIQELRSQLAESQQQFEDFKEKFLLNQATVYTLSKQLAKQVKKYKCEEYKDVIQSVLRDAVQFTEEKLAEQCRQAEELRQYKALIPSQATELTQLREKIREEKDVCRSLIQDIKVLLTPDDPDKSQGPDLQEQLANGRRLAEHQVNRLSPEIDEEEDDGDTYEEIEQCIALSQSQAKKLTQLKEKLREVRDAFHSVNPRVRALLTPDDPDESQGQDLREQLANGHRLEECHVNRLSPVPEVDVEETEDDRDEEMEKVQESAAPREVQKAEEKEVPEDSLKEHAVPCSNSDGPSDSIQPLSSAKVTFEEDSVDSALIVDNESSPDKWENTLNILPELVSAPSAGIKNPPQLEDDALEGSADNTQGHRVTGHIPTSSVLKPKTMKRKCWFCKCIPWPSCLGDRGNPIYGYELHSLPV
ncbi:putative neuroblastoma breakpoint family member 5, partial [Plecturocebus cupreus]